MVLTFVQLINMTIKNSNLRLILLALICASLFIIIDEMIVNNVSTITKPHKTTNFRILNESPTTHEFVKFKETKRAATDCERVPSKLFGKLEIDLVSRNWSTLEAMNRVFINIILHCSFINF